MFNFDNLQITYIFPTLLIICFLIQLIYYLVYYFKPYRLVKKQKSQDEVKSSNKGVSVIIYSNNDSKNLWKNLPLFLDQEYPAFEVIVVNDGFNDQTEEVLTTFENQYDNLYHTYLSEGARNLSRKKLSITLAVKAAKYEYLLFTNANCKPESCKWIENMASNFSDKTDIVFGYFNITSKKGLLYSFINYDLLLKWIRIISYSVIHKPYMGFSNNMGYKKSIFFQQKGFSKHMDKHVGEDDLFLNSVVTRKNTKFKLSKDSRININYEDNISYSVQKKSELSLPS